MKQTAVCQHKTFPAGSAAPKFGHFGRAAEKRKRPCLTPAEKCSRAERAKEKLCALYSSQKEQQGLKVFERPFIAEDQNISKERRWQEALIRHAEAALFQISFLEEKMAAAETGKGDVISWALELEQIRRFFAYKHAL